VKPKPEEAARNISEALLASCAARSQVSVRAVAFTGSASGSRAEKATGQYMDSRMIDPTLSAKVGADTGAEALMVIAVLRYGPEVEGGGVQSIKQGANTRVGASQMSISTSVARAVTWFNAQFRCALVRVSDGAVLWDASVRKRQKRVTLMNVTQESVLQEAVEEIVDTFPWAKPRPAEPR